MKILCIVSGFLFAILCVIWVISIVQVTKNMNAASVGIIGGAGLPTAMFLLQSVYRSPVFHITVAHFLLFSVTGLMLIFGKKKA